MKPKLDRADDGSEVSLITFFRAFPEGAEFLRVSDASLIIDSRGSLVKFESTVCRISEALMIRGQILDTLSSGPKKLVDVVKLLEESGISIRGDNGVKPIQSAVFRLLDEHKIELTSGRELKLS